MNPKNKIINLEGPEKITLINVANRVKELHSNDIDIELTNERRGDYRGKQVANNESKNLLNWKPLIDFKTGSKLLYEYQKENFNNSPSR